jgi:hypothetical protein
VGPTGPTLGEVVECVRRQTHIAVVPIGPTLSRSSLSVDRVFFNGKSPDFDASQHIHKLRCSGELVTFSAVDAYNVWT